MRASSRASASLATKCAWLSRRNSASPSRSASGVMYFCADGARRCASGSGPLALMTVPWCVTGRKPELNKQLSLLGPVNYDDFGGKQKFDEMVKLAKEHVGKGGKVAD